jgi:hypothetical protein
MWLTRPIRTPSEGRTRFRLARRYDRQLRLEFGFGVIGVLLVSFLSCLFHLFDAESFVLLQVIVLVFFVRLPVVRFSARHSPHAYTAPYAIGTPIPSLSPRAPHADKALRPQAPTPTRHQARMAPTPTTHSRPQLSLGNRAPTPPAMNVGSRAPTASCCEIVSDPAVCFVFALL